MSFRLVIRCSLLLGSITLLGFSTALDTPRLHAQNVLPSYSQPSASTRIGAAQANYSQATQGGNRPIAPGVRAPVGGYGGGYGFYPGYGNTYVAPDPYSGYLNGAANVISAQADYMQAQQQTNLTREQVKQAQLDTHHKTLDEWKYEQAAMPTAEELRQKKALAEINRARGNPPLTDIISGDILNTLLVDIQKAQGVGVYGPTFMLEPESLSHINLTDGRSNTGTGLLRNGGKLEWPYTLQLEYFDANRKRVDELLPKAAAEARTGRVQAKYIKQLLDIEDDLRADLKTHIHDLTPSQGVEARRYINELHETFRTLQDPNVSKYVGGTWTAKGENVAQLVDNMTRQGLKFAPAAEGADSYYRSLYNAMLAYDRMLYQPTAQK